jgi:uncharacterized membrane protein YwaF
MRFLRSWWFGVLAHVPLAVVVALVILTVVRTDNQGAEIFVPFIVVWGLGIALTGVIYWDARRREKTDLNLLGISFWGPLYPPYYWWKYMRPT